MISFIAGAVFKAVFVGVVEYYRPGTVAALTNAAVQFIAKIIDKVRP